MSWWCGKCQAAVSPESVTHDERHEPCGCPVVPDSSPRGASERLLALEQANKVLRLSRELLIKDTFSTVAHADSEWEKDFLARIIARYEDKAREALGLGEGPVKYQVFYPLDAVLLRGVPGWVPVDAYSGADEKTVWIGGVEYPKADVELLEEHNRGRG